MGEIFGYEFMRKAFVVGLFVSVIIPCIGTTIVLKRLSMIGDALSHASLAGVAFGLIIGINPVIGAVISCMIAAFAVEMIRKKTSYSEVSIAIITSAAIGIAGILSGFIKNVTSFNSFLFGSIVAISDAEVRITIMVSIIVFFTVMFLYRKLMYISFDEDGARLSGIKVEIVNSIFTIITAMTVSVASRTVGTLIVSSLMVLPVATSMMVSKSYKMTMILSVIFAVFEMILGLTISYYLGFKPGGTIVILSVIMFAFTSLYKSFIKR